MRHRRIKFSEKSFMTEAELKARRAPPTKADKEVAKITEQLTRLEERLKKLDIDKNIQQVKQLVLKMRAVELKLNKIVNLLRKHNNQISLVENDLRNSTSQIDTIKRNVRAYGRKQNTANY